MVAPLREVPGIRLRHWNAPIHQQEGHAVDDQRHRHHHIIVQMRIHPIIQQQTQHGAGDHRNYNFSP